jgi:hypothetical protein
MDAVVFVAYHGGFQGDVGSHLGLVFAVFAWKSSRNVWKMLIDSLCIPFHH